MRLINEAFELINFFSTLFCLLNEILHSLLQISTDNVFKLIK